MVEVGDGGGLRREIPKSHPLLLCVLAQVGFHSAFYVFKFCILKFFNYSNNQLIN